MLETIGRQWWMIALRGFVAVLFGLIALAWPGITIATLVIIFGIYAMVDGLVALIAALRLFGAHGRWWPAFVVGMLGMVIGLIAFFMPLAAVTAIVYLVAFWAVVTGIFEVIAAVHLRRHIAGDWMLSLGGILSIVLGVVLFCRPSLGLIASAWIIGIYALFFGVLLMTLGFRMRALSAGTNMRLRPTL